MVQPMPGLEAAMSAVQRAKEVLRHDTVLLLWDSKEKNLPWRLERLAITEPKHARSTEKLEEWRFRDFIEAKEYVAQLTHFGSLVFMAIKAGSASNPYEWTLVDPARGLEVILVNGERICWPYRSL